MNFPSEFCRAPYQLVMRVPDGVTMTTAAGIRMLELVPSPFPPPLHLFSLLVNLELRGYKKPKDRHMALFPDLLRFCSSVRVQ